MPPPPVDKNVVRIAVLVLLFAGVGAFLGLFSYFFYEIWDARFMNPPAKKATKLDKDLVYAASLIGGILGTYFAVVIGVQKRDPATNEKKLKVGKAIVPGKRVLEALGTFAFLAYLAVGAWALLTFAVCKVQSPDTIKTVAATFGGYIVALMGAVFIGTTAPED
jgi:hypothetical protein